MEKVVGILALQGDFKEHFDILAKLGVGAIPVRLPEDLAQIDRLIIPGGESTTIGKLLVTSKLLQPIRERILAGMPVWGTCAGAILLARRVIGGIRGQMHIGAMDITARRNAFGRQLDSFEANVAMKKAAETPIPAIFIRAPVFERPGKDVEILARLPDERIVAARQKNILVTAFHPELAGSTQLHRYFLNS
ncbi:glutamine amidotransferase subunit PdxT [Candidatus Kaiserbacteria bacterium RIFCSPHIGHO2_01_FULL_58_22]|uniref:Pyridoxal 5'-phosphate synthase subunit PdxT n=1 Tax=Candidatus Kaiserbacteria bacterium GW2011_GWA2_58_9 TaxID=1618672 RepID=A0A0G2BMZ4_9BACT|nr:MAG: Glutamine amidotransferase subunit PdxT [Candidatus Kaiserbacteria bacterium GW2011_GWA2_58_9]OGG63182.1 MAG: glutamine amidotransferase subunit PdxT [Candidatus Kaiserbacteria bacterium RIFCSPHIGHO2_01_FULL_58_22]